MRPNLCPCPELNRSLTLTKGVLYLRATGATSWNGTPREFTPGSRQEIPDQRTHSYRRVISPCCDRVPQPAGLAWYLHCGPGGIRTRNHQLAKLLLSQLELQALLQWSRRGLNSRPLGCEPSALPSELRPHDEARASTRPCTGRGLTSPARLWSWSGSNRLPLGCHPSALPSELQPQQCS